MCFKQVLCSVTVSAAADRDQEYGAEAGSEVSCCSSNSNIHEGDAPGSTPAACSGPGLTAAPALELHPPDSALRASSSFHGQATGPQKKGLCSCMQQLQGGAGREGQRDHDSER